MVKPDFSEILDSKKKNGSTASKRVSDLKKRARELLKEQLNEDTPQADFTDVVELLHDVTQELGSFSVKQKRRKKKT